MVEESELENDVTTIFVEMVLKLNKSDVIIAQHGLDAVNKIHENMKAIELYTEDDRKMFLNQTVAYHTHAVATQELAFQARAINLKQMLLMQGHLILEDGYRFLIEYVTHAMQRDFDGAFTFVDEIHTAMRKDPETLMKYLRGNAMLNEASEKNLKTGVDRWIQVRNNFNSTNPNINGMGMTLARKFLPGFSTVERMAKAAAAKASKR